MTNSEKQLNVLRFARQDSLLSYLEGALLCWKLSKHFL